MAEPQSSSNSTSATSGIRSTTTDSSHQARVMLWCTPRTTSTILTKCLSFVPKTQVFFEPYYFCNEAIERLKSIGINIDPSSMKSYDDVEMKDWWTTANMISGGDCSKEGKPDFDQMKYPYIKELLENPDPEKEVVFLKDMAYCIDGRYQFLPDKSCGYRHVFLLRHPRKVFASWRKVMLDLDQDPNGSEPNGTRSESFHIVKDLPVVYAPPGHFFKELYDLWLHVKLNYDPNPVVLDSDDLLSDPATMLPRFCTAVGIPYSDNLLKWPESPDTTNSWISAFSPSNDFEFIRIYCKNSFNTTHFFPPSPLTEMDSLTEDVKECVEAVMPYYQEMYDSRI
ncbi:uncharacterized protein LOC100892712 [Strongylocentrotus purpuratus]|uniref:Sulfotransferase n=1 Tax=Strongylocentrotus purpuratus TaxID=7668 RepID=A0A7M7HP85_STRPU|nr:uncharacterized protein LOC100892712 [Strongylocentrotus purpuratus]|eukprot:XP_011679841.1 PREDICTED: uncharacterized protein LOC100892712 [Strongylocentrotus purpuratus]